MAQVLYDAGRNVAVSDDDALLAKIKEEARQNKLLMALFRLAEQEQWTTQRTALVIAYTMSVVDNAHADELNDAVARMTRPIFMSTHCATCTCTDKTISIEEAEPNV